MPPPGNEYAAEQLKNSGNKCFKNGDYEAAEGLYSQAIQKNSANPLLFTNRANARLKLEKWEGVIDDCIRSIELLKDNMKAFFYLGMLPSLVGMRQVRQPHYHYCANSACANPRLMMVQRKPNWR
jgi:tetratricopeptide (TPR) repeat protein